MRPMMEEALRFLAGFADAIAQAAPQGKEQEYRDGAIWYPAEPAYSWRACYGDFDPLTIRAGIRKGLIEEPRKNAFRITPAGLKALREVEGR